MLDVQESPTFRVARRYPVGAEPAPQGVSFRVWAPARRRVAVLLDRAAEHPLHPEPGGYFSATVAGIAPGARYMFRLDDDATPYPDPASRRQPDGPHGPSEVVDPAAYRWTDATWSGAVLAGQVIYEMHVGTYTPEGTWAAAAADLPRLADLGVTMVEMLPVAEFPGRFGWGYDGVDLFAPTRLYGHPDELRRFVDAAHAAGIAVILDVVYNHLGPDGNRLTAFTPDDFTDRYACEWGEAVNFDGPNAAGVRELFVSNAAYWIDEFHLDGLRIDATQSLFDSSSRHVLAEIAAAARAAARGRPIVLIGENEPQHARVLRAPAAGGCGLDALWNEDLHHSAMVAITGRRQAYFSDHSGTPQEFVAAARRGWLFQGQVYRWQGKRRGTPALDMAPMRFVNYLQNHDQVANTGTGLRFHRLTSPGRGRAMTALLLLMPGTPMLFQGQEWWASTPFLFFADHRPELALLVSEGRRAFLSQFPALATPEMTARLRDPAAPATFAACKLEHAEIARNADIVALHRDLIRLRRTDPVFAAQGAHGIDGAVLGPEAFVLRFFAASTRAETAGAGDGPLPAGDRLLLVNFGLDLDLARAPEPLLAPPEGHRWRLAWSSENPAYGGTGTPPVETDDRWLVLGHSAVVMAAELVNPDAAPSGSLER